MRNLHFAYMATETTLLASQIQALVEELIAPTPNLFVVEVEVRGLNGGTRKVNVLLDGDQGIGIDEVVEISRALGVRLEEADLIKGAYNLEVGSPGVDHPLGSPRQFAKNIGRFLKVDTTDARALEGTLSAADATTITLTPEAPKRAKKGSPAPEPISLPYDQIKKAVVQIRF